MTEDLMPRCWRNAVLFPLLLHTPTKKATKQSYTKKPVQLREQDKIDSTELINHGIRLGGRLYEMTAQHAEWWELARGEPIYTLAE